MKKTLFIVTSIFFIFIISFTSAISWSGGGILVPSNITNFTQLLDTPSSYSGDGNKCVTVKNDETGLEFISCPGGGSGITNISEAGDVDVSGVSDNDVLKWDDAVKQWIDSSLNSIIDFTDGWHFWSGVNELSFNETKMNETGDLRYANIDGDNFTGNVGWNENNITNASCLTLTNGQPMCWNVDAFTLDIPTGAGNTIQVGQELTLMRKNKAGKIIYSGQIVYDSGSQGERITVDLADASDGDKIHNLGMVTIAMCNDNADCPITYFGDIHDLDTGSFSEGDSLYLSDDGSGNFTTTIPGGLNYSLNIGTVSRNHSSTGIINFQPEVDYGDDPLFMDLRIANNLVVNKNITIGEYINQDNYSIHPVIMNDQVIDGAFCIEMDSPDNGRQCKLIIQPGGVGQASIIRRSFIIVNDATCTGDQATNTSCYAEEGGFNWTIDFDTSLTGADLGVTDDFEVIGDVRVRDTDGEVHSFNRELEIRDELYRNILESRINTSLVGNNMTIEHHTGKNLFINIEEVNYDLGRSSDSILLTEGTNESPVLNHVTYQVNGGPHLETSTTELNSQTDVALVVMGAGYDYGSIVGSSTNDLFINKVYDSFYDRGAIYESGFNISATSNMIRIGEGIMEIIMEDSDINFNHSTDLNAIEIHNDGTFHIHTNNLDGFDSYSTGGAISNNKYFNLICGITFTQDMEGRMYCQVQDEPTNEYVTLSGAEIDNLNTLQFFPTHDTIKKLYIPAIRVVMQRSGGTNTIQTLSSGSMFLDLRGATIGSSGSSPSPSISSHSDLNNLNWASAGHTFDTNLDVGIYNVSANWFKGLFNWEVTPLDSYIISLFDGAELQIGFNETKLNETISVEGILLGFNSTFNQTYDDKNSSRWDLIGSDIFYNSGNINASGDICTTGGNCLSDVGGGSGGGVWGTDGTDIYNLTAKVGIGTDAPDEKLHLKSTVNNQEINIKFDGKDILGFPRTANINFNPLSNFLGFEHGVNIAGLSSSGRFGIGTTAPSEKLEVDGGIRAIKYIGIGPVNNNNNYWAFINGGTRDANHIEFAFSIRDNNDEGWIFGFDGTTFKNFIKMDYPSGVVTFDEDDVIFNGGDIGIGISNPNTKLHVDADSGGVESIIAFFEGGFSGGDTSEIVMGADSTTTKNSIRLGFEYNAFSSNTNKAFLKFKNGDEIISMLAGGNVGIGTSSPSYPLEVGKNDSGQISIYAKANISATGFITRTSVFDKTKETKDYIKDADEYKKQDGKIDHKRFYGYVNWSIPDKSKPVFDKFIEFEVCSDVSIDGVIENVCEIVVEESFIYPFNKTEEGVDLGMEIDVLRQRVYEQSLEILDLFSRLEKLENLKSENDLIKEDLCSLGISRWC